MNLLTTRTFRAIPDTYDEAKHSVRVTLATEEPVEVFDWERWEVVREVLLISGCELPDQIPLLDSHDRSTIDKVLGSLRDFTKVDGRLEAMMSFTSVDEGAKAETKVREGHVTDLSAGYRQIESVWIEKNTKAVVNGREFTGPLRVTVRWQPKEGSLTPIGADVKSKVRSLLMSEQVRKELESRGLATTASDEQAMEFLQRTLKQSNSNDPPIITKGAQPMPPTQEEVLKAERERVREIEAFAAKFTGRVEKIDELKRAAIEGGTTIEQFRGDIALRLANDSEPIETPPTKLGLNEREQKEYSLLRIIQSELTGGKIKAEFERDCGEEIKKRSSDKVWKGVPIPWDIQSRSLQGRFSQREVDQLRMIAMQHGLMDGFRALTSTTATGAAELVGTDLRADLFVNLLRNRSVASLVGVQILFGLQGNLTIPKQTGAATWEWTGETGTTTGSALTTGSITMSPHEGRAFQEYHRMLLLQSSPSIEMLVQNDLFSIARLGIDKAVFHGTAANNQPRGIALETGIGSVLAANAGWDAIVEFETDVATANADIETMFYVMNAAARGILKTRLKALNTAIYLMDERGMVNGYPSKISNQITDAHVFFGDFSPELLGYWGNLDLLVNPYAKDKEGITRVNIFADVDCRLRQAASISMASDLS